MERLTQLPLQLEGIPEAAESFPTGERIVEEAMKYLGAPAIKHTYDHLGMSPKGFDCSGFVTRVLQDSGIHVPDTIRHVSEYINDYDALLVHIPKPGDLIFISRKGIAPSHMGIVVDEERYIHASKNRTGYVAVTPWETDPPPREGEQIIYNRNPVAIKRAALRNGRYFDTRNTSQ